MPQRSEKLKVGDAAPEFCLPEGLKGEEVCLRDYRGHNLLLMFMRGSWWGHCRRYMVHVLGMREELEKRDAEVLGVTSQDAEELEKYLTFHETPGKVVNDTGKEVMKLYGLEDDVGPPRGIIYTPADIIIDREGIMRFVYVWEDSSDYPDDREMLVVLDGI